MGRNRVVVAVLLEHSVNVATSRESNNEMAKGGISSRGARLFPNHLDRPEFCKYYKQRCWAFWEWSLNIVISGVSSVALGMIGVKVSLHLIWIWSFGAFGE